MAERVLVKRLGQHGDGIADGLDGPIYIPGSLPGETVEVETVAGHPDRRRLVSVERPSAERIEPICPHFQVCGGCAMQHYSENSYRAWKRDLVVTALNQAGIEVPVAPLIDAHGDGRRRVVFHARRGGHGVLQVGFSAAAAHRIVPIDRCPILAETLDGALKAAWAIAEATAALIALKPQKSQSGVYHLTAAGSTTWAGFAQQILEEYEELYSWPVETGDFGAPLRANKVVAITSDLYKTAARRPKNSLLSNAKLESVFGLKMPDWRAQLSLAMQDAIR